MVLLLLGGLFVVVAGSVIIGSAGERAKVRRVDRAITRLRDSQRRRGFPSGRRTSYAH